MKEFEEFTDEEQEEGGGIDIIAMVSLLWKRRWAVLKVTGICMAIGLFLAIFSPEKYVSQCTFVPQMSQGMSSRYSSIASMMGIDMSLTSSGTDGQINPRLYPLLLDNPYFQMDLMNVKLHFERASEPITIYDYYTKSEYRKFNLISFIARYTIGLPRLFVSWITPTKEPVIFETPLSEGETSGPKIQPVLRMTKEQDMVARTIAKSLKMEVDIKKGFLTLTSTMPEAYASAELCQAAYQLMQEYVREYKKMKSEENLKFISSELAESKKNYETAQNQLAYYMDSNFNIDRATAKIKKIRLESDYELAKQMFAELSKQELSAKVKVNEDTVAFTEVSPASVPIKRASPKRAMMMVVWTFLGVCFGCAYVIGKDKYQTWKEGRAKEELAS